MIKISGLIHMAVIDHSENTSLCIPDKKGPLYVINIHLTAGLKEHNAP